MFGEGVSDNRKVIKERIGHHRFSQLVDGFRIHTERLRVVLGQGQDLEPTGYAFYRRNEPGEPPRVCRMPWVLSESQCANGCPHFPSCPDASELFIKSEEAP